MFSNNKNFYPTPDWLIKAMLMPYYDKGVLKLSRKRILEPSAGKGSIIDFVYKECEKSWSRFNPKQIYAFEIDPDLQAILMNKKCKVIGSDFLEADIQRTFDLIIMNPPFDKGARHLLKAWEILEDGDIVCLLNEETLKNPCTEERELLKRIIKDNNGHVEYLGNCFQSAERKTNVNVAMVRLSKVAKDRKNVFEDTDFEKASFDFQKSKSIPSTLCSTKNDT